MVLSLDSMFAGRVFGDLFRYLMLKTQDHGCSIDGCGAPV